MILFFFFFFFSSRRRHTRLQGDWSSDVCSSDLSASQRSSFKRVALRGAAPVRKLRSPFGLMETALAAPRNEIRAVSRATASRSSGTGSVGTLRRLALKQRPGSVHFVRFAGDYTVVP